MAGAALTVGLVGASYLGTAKAIEIAYRIGTSHRHGNGDPIGMDLRCIAQPGR